jgi:hypothetical protein
VLLQRLRPAAAAYPFLVVVPPEPQVDEKGATVGPS